MLVNFFEIFSVFSPSEKIYRPDNYRKFYARNDVILTSIRGKFRGQALLRCIKTEAIGLNILCLTIWLKKQIRILFVTINCFVLHIEKHLSTAVRGLLFSFAKYEKLKFFSRTKSLPQISNRNYSLGSIDDERKFVCGTAFHLIYQLFGWKWFFFIQKEKKIDKTEIPLYKFHSYKISQFNSFSYHY